MKYLLASFFTMIAYLTFAQSFTESPQFTHYLDNSMRQSSISILGNLPYDGIGKNILIAEMPNSITSSYGVSQISSGLYNNLFGNIVGGTITPGHPLEFKIQGSQQGEWNGRLTSRLESKKMAFTTIADGYRFQRGLDKNNDNFLDISNKDRLILSQGISYTGKRFNSNLSAYYININNAGGQTDFEKETDYMTTNSYGTGQEVENIGFHWNSSIYLDKNTSNKKKFLKLQVNGIQHQQDNFYGLRRLKGEEQFLDSRLFYSRRRPFGNTQIGIAHRYQNIHQEAFRQTDELLNQDISINRLSVFGARSSYFNNRNQIKTFVRIDYEDGKIEAFPRFQIDFNLSPKRYNYYNRNQWGHLSFFVAREKRLALHVFENEHYLNSYRTFDWQTFDEKYDKGWTTGVAYKSKAFNFEFPGTWIQSSIPVSKIVWKTVMLQDYTKAIFYDAPDTSRARLQFDRSDNPRFQHLLEIATGLNFERLIGRVLLRWNMPKVDSRYLVPRTSMVLQAGYKATFGVGSSLTWYHQGKQYLNDGTLSPRNNRWDWRFSVELNQFWQNYFTDNSTFYFGFNNMGNRRQADLVTNPETPFDADFDASQVWGNTVGSQFYFGYKFRAF